MKGQKEVKISYWAAHLTTIVSVTLLLLIMGIITLISVSAAIETRKIREKIELNAILSDSISQPQAEILLKFIQNRNYTRTARLITKDEALKNWTSETGENLEELFGINPLSPEISFSIKAEFAGLQSINNIKKHLENQPGIEGVASPDGVMIEAMNRNIENITWILGCIGVIMIIISFVLINNTVHLTIYSKRFTIHTMQLVGATNGFIRRPFIINDIIAGVIAGIIASLILALSLWGADNSGITDLTSFIHWQLVIIIFGALILSGAFICGLAASIATTRYLKKRYEDLFN